MANLLKALARNYRKLARYEDADEYYRKALTLKREILGPDHEDVAESMRSLANNILTRVNTMMPSPLQRIAEHL